MLANVDANKHYLFHYNLGHTTKECKTSKDKIEELIKVDQLKQYIKKDWAECVTS